MVLKLASGSRIPGVYQGGETVSYSVIVKNTGTAALKKINVKDSPDKVLLDLIEADSPGFFPGEDGVLLDKLVDMYGKERDPLRFIIKGILHSGDHGAADGKG